MSYELISSKIKQGLYTFDQYQTYDLLWWDNVHQNHKNLLKLVWLNHWIFSPQYQDFYPVLIERFTPWGYAWANDYSYNLWAFLAPLTRYGVLEVPELSGARWGFDNPTNLQFPESISVDTFPDEITLNIPANESVVITWLEYDQGGFYPYPVHPNIDASIVIIRKNYKFFKASKSARSIKINTSKWLVNSLVITGTVTIPEDNGTLLYSDQMSRLTGIANQLNLPYPRILKSFVVNLQCENGLKEYRNIPNSNKRDYLYSKYSYPDYSIPLWQNVPEWYFFAGVSFGNNNHWNNGVSSDDVGYPLSPIWDGSNIYLEKWYLNQADFNDLTEIQTTSIEVKERQVSPRYHLGDFYRNNSGLIFGVDKHIQESDYDFDIRSSFNSDYMSYGSQIVVDSGYEYYRNVWKQGGEFTAGFDMIDNLYSVRSNSSFCSGFFSISELDFRLVNSVKSFVWMPITVGWHEHYGDNPNGDDSWFGATSENHQFIIEQIRNFQDSEWQTQTQITASVTGSLYFEFSFFAWMPPMWIPPSFQLKSWSNIEEASFTIEVGLWDNSPAANWQYNQVTFQGIRDTIDNIDFDPTNYVMPDSVRVKEIHAALQADKYSDVYQSLGRQIEQISQVLGLNFNSDGSIKSVRQSKWIPQGETLPAGWPIGQWGTNTGGSTDGQQGGLDTEDRLGMAYEVRGNRFEISEKTGEVTKIEEGGYVLVENWPQLFHIYLNELDKDLGLQSLGAMVVPSADGTNYTKIEGLASAVSEILYMLSSMSVNTSQTHTGVLKSIALLQENLKALGVPTQLKAIDIDMGEDKPYKLPYSGLQSDSPSLTDLLMLLASNVSVIVASLQYFQFEPEQEDS